MKETDLGHFEPKTICVKPELWNVLTEVSEVRYGKRYKLSRLVREILADWVNKHTHGDANAQA